MIKIEYFLLAEEAKIFEKSINFEVFKSLNNFQFQKNYFDLKQKKLLTDIVFLDELNLVSLENDKVLNYYDRCKDKFPLVFLNDELIKDRDLLDVDELSDILDIGLSIQENPISNDS